MINIFMISLFLLFLLAGIFFYLKNQKGPKPDSLLLMQQQMDSLRQQLSDSLLSSTQIFNQQMSELTNRVNDNLRDIAQQMISTQQNVGDRLDSASRVIGEVQRNLGSLSQATARIFEVGKDIAGLQEILRAPKLRGILGELFLGELLQQILPSSNYILQYKFKSGEVVDAVIKLGQLLVSVDSKFPLENFRKIVESGIEEDKRLARRRFINDVKKHIDNVATKYIVPDEGTFDFALMYIPAENIYYELIIKDNIETEQSLSGYALGKRVIPASPNSFYAYLQAIVLGLKGLKVEKNVQEIIQHLSRLSGDMQRFKQDFDIIGRHIVNIKNKYDEADKKINIFENKLLNLCHIDNHNKLTGNDDSQT